MSQILTSPRVEGEVDVVKEVVKILDGLGHRCPSQWLTRLPPRTQHELSVGNSVLQRFLINDAFRISLGLLECPTHQARSVLVDQSSLADWLACFKKIVAPIVVDYEL